MSMYFEPEVCHRREKIDSSRLINRYRFETDCGYVYYHNENTRQGNGNYPQEYRYTHCPFCGKELGEVKI